MDLYTSNMNYSGEDRLDITVKGQDPIGQYFAPTWDMVKGLKSGSVPWEYYVISFDNLIDERMTKGDGLRRAIINLLKREEVTLVCYCKNPDSCHRTLVANMLSTHFGANYKGERKR